MEVNKFKDFQKLYDYDTATNVWFVDVPTINKGESFYDLDFPILEGRLRNAGWNISSHPYEETIEFEENNPYIHDYDKFRHKFKIYEDDTNTLNGCKVFTKEREAKRYWRKIAKEYQIEIDELNSKYIIKMSDICDKFGINKTDSNKVIILKYD